VLDGEVGSVEGFFEGGFMALVDDFLEGL